MSNRKKHLKAQQKRWKWDQLGFRRPAPCPICGKQTVFLFEQYDALCCISCDEWLDKPCGDPACPFCAQRPQTPWEAYDKIDTNAGSAAQRKRWRQDNYQHKAHGMRKHERRRSDHNP